METTGVAAALLPDDALTDVFRRLPPRSLAAARRVCTAWRGVVDARALLRPYQDLLRHSAHGVFINYVDCQRAHLLARRRPPSSTTPSPAGIIDSALGFVPKDLTDHWWVLDHCRGLLLCAGLGLFVCNPATRQWKRLPSCIRRGRRRAGMYLAFDPAVSPHYEVFLIPAPPKKPSPKEPCDHHHSMMEWPPTPWTLEVFSSSTGRWEERAFARQGKPAGTVQEIWLDPEEPTFYGPRQRYALCHKGDLYVHCQGHFIARFTLSSGTYQVIQTPAYTEDTWGKPYLGRPENEVCFGIVLGCKIRIWILNESHGQLEWILKYRDDELTYSSHYQRRMDAPWMLDDAHKIHENDDDNEKHRDNNGNDSDHDEDDEGGDDDSNYSDDKDSHGDEDDEGIYDNCSCNDDEDDDGYDNDSDEDDEGNDDPSNYNGDEDNEGNGDNKQGHNIAAEIKVKERVEWESDHEDFITIQGGPEEYYNSNFDIIGFHPYKKIVFLADFLEVVAYRLTSSKIQYLGYSRPKDYYTGHANGIYESFVYTPCMIPMLDEENASQIS